MSWKSDAPTSWVSSILQIRKIGVNWTVHCTVGPQCGSWLFKRLDVHNFIKYNNRCIEFETGLFPFVINLCITLWIVYWSTERIYWHIILNLNHNIFIATFSSWRSAKWLEIHSTFAVVVVYKQSALDFLKNFIKNIA